MAENPWSSIMFHQEETRIKMVKKPRRELVLCAEECMKQDINETRPPLGCGPQP